MYGLAVCFFAVACFVITLGIAWYDIVQIVDPEFTLNRYLYERYQSNDVFRAAPGAIPGRDEKERQALSEEEVTKRREAAYTQALRAEKHDGKQSLLPYGHHHDRRCHRICHSLADCAESAASGCLRSRFTGAGRRSLRSLCPPQVNGRVMHPGNTEDA